MDTSTSAITVAVHDGDAVLAQRSVLDARAHTEHLAPLITEVLEAADLVPAEVTDVAVGVGPGPFTGLRVGLVTARTFAHALGLPAHGVVSLDALAHAAVTSGSLSGATEFVVATDARRKEVYLARYVIEASSAVRVGGPDVIYPADIPNDLRRLPAVGRGALLYPDVLPDAVGPLDVSAASVAEVAISQLTAGVEVGLDALYLRRPDAQPSAATPKSTVPTSTVPTSTVMAPRRERG